MNKKSIFKLGSGVAATAIASFAMLGTGHADQSATDRAELGITGINFATLDASGGNAHGMDTNLYDRVNLGPLSSTLWAPKRGAQGPMRDDTASEQQMQWRDIESRLGGIGGSNTP